jgi:glyoxylase-like metal-dependent hydrolase (beta-lactamase superfamily II)
MKSFGVYQTNCYIVNVEDKEIVIDPGIGAVSWVMANVKNPVALLNTHGHFDHTWSDKELKESLNIPIYIHKDDAFMLKKDPFSQGTPPCEADFEIDSEESFYIDGIKVKFWHFPGHTPGCSAIEIEDAFFSGDFIFKNSIGRVDFPYSNAKEMKMSIKKFLNIKYDKKVYPGHGEPTTIKAEQRVLPFWLNEI